MALLRLLAVADAAVAEAAVHRARALAVAADADRRLLITPMRRRTANRLPRQLFNLRFSPADHRRLVAELALPVRLPPARHQQVEEAGAEGRCRRLPVPAAHPRAEVSRTGPVTEQSRRAS